MIHVKGPRVLVRPRDPEHTQEVGGHDVVSLGASEGGLIERVALASEYRAPVTMGRVLQLGTEPVCPHCHKGRPFDVQVGDVIVFAPSAGEFVYFDDQRLIILNHTDIDAVLDRVAQESHAG
jgi:co-chaperonin GroES (HSP10)